MARVIRGDPQSKGEIRTHFVSMEADLPDGVTVQSAIVNHRPPSGYATTPVVTIDSPLIMIKLGPLDVVGWHILDILASYSNGEKSSLRLVVLAIY